MAWTLGLTGGIGSGKSTAAGFFLRSGVPVVDADAVSRSLTAAGGLAVSAVAEHFGHDFIDASGAMDRARMRALVFDRPEKRRELEAILTPLIQAECLRKLEAAKAEAEKKALPFIVFDCPLLLESFGARAQVDRILVIDADEAEQIRRTVRRSKLAEERVRTIIAAQMPRRERILAADDIIFNGGTTDELFSALRSLSKRLGLRF